MIFDILPSTAFKSLLRDKRIVATVWKNLANCIEETITGQKRLIDYPETIRTLARRYTNRIIHRQAAAENEGVSPDYATVDLNSVDNEEARRVGAEHVVYETIKQLGIGRKLKEPGLSGYQIAAAIGTIAGRMIVPGSERATHYWLQNVSALGELMGFDFSTLSLDRLYKERRSDCPRLGCRIGL